MCVILVFFSVLMLICLIVFFNRGRDSICHIIGNRSLSFMEYRMMVFLHCATALAVMAAV